MRARSMLLSLLLLSGAALWADTITTVPGHFTINLNDPGCVPGGEISCNGWDQGQLTQFMLQFNTNETLDDGFTQNIFCLGGCPVSSFVDPSMEMDAGGASIPITSNDFTFIDDGNTCPDGICSFQNATGIFWNNVLVTETNQVYPDQTVFTCATNLYAECGIRNDSIQVLFTGIDPTTNRNGIPTTVPEPGTLTLLLTAAGVCAIGRRRKTARQPR